MPFDKISAPTVKDMFVRKIENMILSGELEIGSRLPSERDLAERMKISKTAVHDGICDMVRKGFLEVVPRQGIFVGDYARNGTLEALESIMQYDGGRLDTQNKAALLEMRGAVEGLALKKVIEANDPEVLLQLKAILSEAERLAAAGGSEVFQQLAECYFRFHHLICVASGNTLAPLIFNAFRTPSISIWAASARTLGPENSVGRLRTFVEAIETRDMEAALEHLNFIIRDCRQKD